MSLMKRLFLLTVFLSLTINLLGQNYTFKNFSYQEGLNLISLLTVEESEDGYLWFGTNGAGLMRFDGKEFNSLADKQGRNNRHVNYIFIQENRLLFSTLYRGAYSLGNSKIEKLSAINEVNRTHAIVPFNGNYVVIQNSGLRIFKNRKLIEERSISTFKSDLNHYGAYQFKERLFLFNSEGNFCVNGNSIFDLDESLKVDKAETKDFILAYQNEEKLFFVDKKLKFKSSVRVSEFGKSKLNKVSLGQDILEVNEYVVKWHERKGLYAMVTNLGNVFTYNIETEVIQNLTQSSRIQIQDPTDILIDGNDDIWVTSKTNGAFRISLEPFTSLSANENYKKSHISFISETLNDKKVISVFGEGTYIEEDHKENAKKKISFELNKEISVSSMTFIDDTTIVSTRRGVYRVEGSKLLTYERLDFLADEKVSLVFNAFNYLWYSIESRGLFRLDLEKNKIDSFDTAPAYFYNAILSDDKSKLYFGTNYGIVEYSKRSNKLNAIQGKSEGEKLGFYVGNSTKDIYGNLWFSLDKGLFGITQQGKQISITEAKFLPSLLIYTLNADAYGNLIIGTNKGITVLKVNEKGTPLESSTYDKNNGFYGHETHMRSSFQQEDGSILIGTLGGLVLVRPEYFDKDRQLNKPVIYDFENKGKSVAFDSENPVTFDSEANNFSIYFKSINTKSSFVTYSYRLLGGKRKHQEWSEFTPNEKVNYYNLTAGQYTFEVKSSINGDNESEVRTFNFAVEIPFYKSRWFIILMIGALVIVSIIVLDRSSKFNRNNIILSRDVVANRSIAKSILVFGALINTFGHVFAPRVDDTLEVHDESAIFFGGVIMLLFFIVSFIDRKLTHLRIYLAIGFLILLGYNLSYIYLSNLHPFYFVCTLLVTFIAPYTLERLKSAVIVSLVLGIVSVLLIFLVEKPLFNHYLFLMGVAITCFLMIYKTYLRNNSFEQLIFTSGIVNKGNALVVAFNKTGKISYASENVEMLLGIRQPLKGESILKLNEFQPPINNLDDFGNENLIENFKEGAIFVTPLIAHDDEVVFYQWSCKQFSDELRIILGQDVTEKINLENYYELIVRNAGDLIFQTDTLGNLTFVNEKCCEVFERTSAELLNYSILDLTKSSFQSEVRSFFEKNLKDRDKDEYKEFPITTPKGEVKWLGMNLTSMKRPGAENVVTGFLGLARDITETKRANSIIKEQNKDITDSINYARRIQYNLLPNESDFDELFDEHLILYQPKDIVSGDFFWLKKIEDKTILILSDCTGHGVPGSFMTLLGINILDQIILEEEIYDPGEILNLLDSRLAEILTRKGEQRIPDGMEMSILVFNQNKEVDYALAGGRFIVYDEKSRAFDVVKGQSKHIGDLSITEDFEYATESLKISNHHALYLFTDGYPDQFGGDKNKKLKIKRFLSIVESSARFPMDQQGEFLHEYLNKWTGELSQTDDVTVIGVKGKK